MTSTSPPAGTWRGSPSSAFLYRLSPSPFAERFVLKGALLMLVWLGETIRPTRDGDLLGFGDLSPRSLATLLAEVCAAAVALYGGRRVRGRTMS